eukprot:6196687-Pleurochrysis_carterae.AAC.1
MTHFGRRNGDFGTSQSDLGTVDAELYLLPSQNHECRHTRKLYHFAVLATTITRVGHCRDDLVGTLFIAFSAVLLSHSCHECQTQSISWLWLEMKAMRHSGGVCDVPIVYYLHTFCSLLTMCSLSLFAPSSLPCASSCFCPTYLPCASHLVRAKCKLGATYLLCATELLY